MKSWAKGTVASLATAVVVHLIMGRLEQPLANLNVKIDEAVARGRMSRINRRIERDIARDRKANLRAVAGA